MLTIKLLGINSV